MAPGSLKTKLEPGECGVYDQELDGSPGHGGAQRGAGQRGEVLVGHEEV